jgi:hypothetical protein
MIPDSFSSFLFGVIFIFFVPEKHDPTSHYNNRTMPSLQYVLAVSPDDNHASEDPSTGSRKRKEVPTLEYDDQTQTPPLSPSSPRRLTKEGAPFSPRRLTAKDITPGECQS